MAVRKINCPICKNTLFLMEDNSKFVDFNLKKATDKVKCPTCKRKIEYSIVEKEQLDIKSLFNQ